MMNLQIRNATPADADRSCEIATAAWEPIYAGYRLAAGDTAFDIMFPEAHRAKGPQVRASFEPGACQAIVSESEGVVVGFATYAIDEGGQVGRIGNNAVHPDSQGRGIGTEQLQAVLQRLREAGCKVATVTTGLDEQHAPARAIYERGGFRQFWQGVTYIRELPYEGIAEASASPGTIRTAKPEDADRVCEIGILAWVPVFEEFRRRAGDDVYRILYPTGAQCKDAQLRPVVTAHPNNAIVTEMDDAVVGFATHFARQNGQVGEIGNNAVHPSFQGRGIGAAQMREALRRMTDAGCRLARVFTGLDIAHAPARMMYERVGFRQWWQSVMYIREL